MLKKIGFVTAGVAAGMAMLSGFASAEDGPSNITGIDENRDDVSLLDLENLDLLHNVNAAVGVCDNNINVLGIQVPVEDVANGLNVPVLSPGHNQNSGAQPDNCAVAVNHDGGSIQDNN